MSASWIQKLSESDSRLHKEDVILQALTAAKLGNDISSQFLRGLSVCYNPFVTFGVKKIPDTVGITNAENPVDDFDQLLKDLSARRLTGHDARDAIQGLSERFDSDEWNYFYAPILRRDMRVGVSEKTINKICKKTEYEIPVFGCQLATNSEGRPEMRGTKRLEPKLDGVRVLMMVVRQGTIYPRTTSVVCYSRNGKEFDNFSHIEDQVIDNVSEIIAAADKVDDIQSGILKEGFVLDGEVVGNTFQELMRQARRKDNVDADDSIFHVFDIIPLADFQRGYWNAPLSKRIALLETMKTAFAKMPNAELLPHLQVDLDTSEGNNQLERYAKDMVNAGFEGIMIKNLEAPYLCKRSTDWMKWKPVHDYDLTVIGIEPGTGKHKGRMGALVCEGEDDGKHIVVNVGSGYTDTERQEYWDDQTSVIGQTVVVMADAVTMNQDGSYSLRFPRFKTFRTDK
jgi:DNA ligase-1